MPLELIVAHCRRSAPGRVHFITTGSYKEEGSKAFKVRYKLHNGASVEAVITN
jgi:hypothetical protein